MGCVEAVCVVWETVAMAGSAERIETDSLIIDDCKCSHGHAKIKMLIRFTEDWIMQFFVCIC